MPNNERIVLEVDERPAVAGAQKANAELAKFEAAGKRASQAAERVVSSTAETIVRITDRSRQSIDRLVQSAERKASFAGLTGADRLIKERDVLLNRLQGESAAIDRVRTAYGRLIEAETKTASTAERVANAIRKPTEAASGAVQSLISRFGGVGLVAGAAAAAVGTFTTAAFHMVEQAGGAAEAMFNLAERTGLSIGQVDKLQAMAKAANVNIESLEGSSRILAETLADSGANGDKAQRALQKLGIATFDATGKQRELGQVTVELIERLSRVENVAERNALANATLGRSGKELLPLIKQYKELDEVVSRRGYGSRDALLESLGRAGDMVDDLSLRWDALKTKLAGKLIGVVEIVTRVVDVASSGFERNLGTAPGTLGSVTGRQAASLATHGGIPEPQAILDRIAAFAEQQAAALRGQDFSRRFASTIEGRQARLREIVGEIGDALQRARAGVVGAESSLNRLNAEKEFLEDSIKRAREAAEKARSLSSFQISGEVPSASNRPRQVPSLFSPRERLGFENLSSTVFVSSEADRAATAAGSIAANLDRARAVGEGIAQNEAVRNRLAIDAAQREAQFQERKLELLANGPGSELAVVGQIARLRLESLDKQLALGADALDIERQRADVMMDAELRVLELQRKRFDEIRDYAGRVFDSLLLRTQSFGDALKSVLRDAFLRPLSDFASEFTASILTGGRGRSSSGGAGGILGGLLGNGGGLAAALGGFGGFGSAGAPGGTGGFAGPVTSIPGLIGIGQQGGGLVIPGFGNAGGSAAGLGGLFAGLKTQAGLSGAAGLGTLGVGAAGLGLLGSFKLGQSGSSLRGLAPVTGAAAGLFGFGALASLFPSLIAAGPLGWALAGGLGAGIGIISLLRDSAEEKIIAKTKQIYGISIDRKFAKNPLLGIVKSGFGGNLDVGLRSQQVRDLVELYAMSTGQPAYGINAANRITPRSFALSGGSFTQQPSYWNGMSMPLDSLAGSGAGVTNAAPQEVTIVNHIVVDGQIVQTQTMKAIANNPRAVQSAVMNATRQNFGRREQLATMLQPGAALA